MAIARRVAAAVPYLRRVAPVAALHHQRPIRRVRAHHNRSRPPRPAHLRAAGNKYDETAKEWTKKYAM